MAFSEKECLRDYTEDGKDVFKALNASLSAGQTEEAKGFFLCLVRSACHKHIGEISGPPSLLIEEILQSPVDTNFSKDLDMLKSAHEDLKEAREVLFRLESDTDYLSSDPLAVPRLTDLYKKITSAIQAIQSVGHEKRLIADEESVRAESFPKIIKRLYPFESAEELFKAVNLGLQYFGEQIIGKKYVNNNFWFGQYPQTENPCSDALEGYLTAFFSSYEIEVNREVYFKEFRCDFCFTYKDWKIPAEAKTQSHKELWRALENQLIKGYTVNNSTCNFGIYIVYWFGVDHDITGTPQNARYSKPNTHEEMKSLLKSNCIPEGHNDYIEIMCLNCKSKV